MSSERPSSLDDGRYPFSYEGPREDRIPPDLTPKDILSATMLFKHGPWRSQNNPSSVPISVSVIRMPSRPSYLDDGRYPFSYEGQREDRTPPDLTPEDHLSSDTLDKYGPWRSWRILQKVVFERGIILTKTGLILRNVVSERGDHPDNCGATDLLKCEVSLADKLPYPWLSVAHMMVDIQRFAPLPDKTSS